MSLHDESLLGELALRLAKSPEDVATEALAYILARSDAARSTVQRLAEEWCPWGLRPIVSFRSQVVGGDAARPDLEAQDADGVPVVIFAIAFGSDADYDTLRSIAEASGGQVRTGDLNTIRQLYKILSSYF